MPPSSLYVPALIAGMLITVFYSYLSFTLSDIPYISGFEQFLVVQVPGPAMRRELQ
jgi:hypothetical protein